MKGLKFYLLVALAALVGACATLTAPRNLDDSIAYGYSQIAAARGTAAALLDRGAIGVAEAQRVQSQSDQARAALDTARIARGSGDIGNAENQLKLALDILLQLETYLKSQEAK
jgi:hypothetical protein